MSKKTTVSGILLVLLVLATTPLLGTDNVSFLKWWLMTLIRKQRLFGNEMSSMRATQLSFMVLVSVILMQSLQIYMIQMEIKLIGLQIRWNY